MGAVADALSVFRSRILACPNFTETKQMQALLEKNRGYELFYKLWQNSYNLSFTEIVELLATCNADVNHMDSNDKDGLNCFEVAANNGHHEVRIFRNVMTEGICLSSIDIILFYHDGSKNVLIS